MEKLEIKQSYERVLASMATACKRYQRSLQEVELLAVSKTRSASEVRSAFLTCGLKNFGENYAQELKKKAEELRDLDISWHFVGQLQANKIATIVRYAESILAVDNRAYAVKIAESAERLKKTPYKIFIAVNLASEPGKSGVALGDAGALAEYITEDPRLDLQGLMAVPPAYLNDASCHDTIPEIYKNLVIASRQIGRGLVSLGMTDDLQIAIGAGSNQIRIGRALFGDRI